MRTLAIACVLLLLAAACQASGSACNDARTTISSAMDEICNGRDDGGDRGYATSNFCRRCVAQGYYATTGASVCQCKHLTFDTDFCSYETNGDAKSKVRSAIDWADSVCADFAPPTAIPPSTDGGADAADDAGADTAEGDSQ